VTGDYVPNKVNIENWVLSVVSGQLLVADVCRLSTTGWDIKLSSKITDQRPLTGE